MKHTAFPWPLGGLIRWFGGVPVNREAAQDLVGAGFDYARREVRLLGTVWPTGNLDADLPGIVARFTDITPRRPERLSAPLRRARAARDRRPAAQAAT